MVTFRPLLLLLYLSVALAVAAPPSLAPAVPEAKTPFQIDEATIAQVHAAMNAGTLTCRALVNHYLARIAAYDRKGPSLNSIVVVNRAATSEADLLDERFAHGGLTGPLHCVPVIVKDNLETIGMPSTAGSLSLHGFASTRDATIVKRMKAAGAIVLAKSNMAEFGLSPLTTINSLQGLTRNPYALDRVVAGSSGGTAAAIAANFGLVGVGTDTGSSIRGPASHTALVGIRPTMGLTSRTGMIPLNYLSDVTGPMTRTVQDAAAVLEVIAGEDPEDPATAASHGRQIPAYATSLVVDGLRGARLGVLRQAYEGNELSIDPEVEREFVRALQDMKNAGAVIVDSAHVEQIPAVPGAESCRGLKYDLNEYLAEQGDRTPVHSLEEIIEGGEFHSSVREELLAAQNATEDGPGSQACKANAAYRQTFAAVLTKAMDDLGLDALIYPTWSQPPQLTKSVSEERAGETAMFASASGFPAMTVPIGVTRGVLPAGMSFLGRAWSEATLIKLAYSYEQATHRRQPPATVPIGF
jgi:amidase